jgi:hypothetical protein
MVRAEQETAQQCSTHPKRASSSVARGKVLILAKQEYLDGQLDLNGYQKRLRSLGWRYMTVFDN